MEEYYIQAGQHCKKNSIELDISRVKKKAVSWRIFKNWVTIESFRELTFKDFSITRQVPHYLFGFHWAPLIKPTKLMTLAKLRGEGK